MSRRGVLMALAAMMLAGTLPARSDALGAGRCKPVTVCEKVQPVKVCGPVNLVPACGPVKVCERVDGHVGHVPARARLALLLRSKKRPASHYREHRGSWYQVVPASPHSANPGEKRTEPAPAPQPAPPLPDRT